MVVPPLLLLLLLFDLPSASAMMNMTARVDASDLQSTRFKTVFLAILSGLR